jgi:hypothetical protein
VLEPDYFARKREELGLDRADTLARVQKVLDERYGGRARARQLHQGVLRIVTPSASVASELRMRQTELLERCDLAGTRLAISIQGLDG